MSTRRTTPLNICDQHGLYQRRALVTRIMSGRGGSLVVSGLGNPTYDVAASGDLPTSFYFWGGMGLAASTGLGVALAQPARRVVVVTGDGEMLMGAGSLATIANAAPHNLAIWVLDNQRFGETGGQLGLTAGPTDIAAMAKAAGFALAIHPVGDDGVAELDRALFHTPGPVMCVSTIAAGEDKRVLPSMDGVFLARRFRAACNEQSASEC